MAALHHRDGLDELFDYAVTRQACQARQAFRLDENSMIHAFANMLCAMCLPRVLTAVHAKREKI